MTYYLPSRTLLGIISLVLAFAAPVASQSSVDPSFNAVPAAALPNDANFQQIIQPDGKVIVYGAPSMYVNGELRSSGMFRLNTDGSLDTTFSYNNEAGVGINNIMLAPDGKIVVGGSISPNDAKIVRLNSNGSLDTSFSVFFDSTGSPGQTGASYTLNAVQPDGKVIATLTHWGNIMGTWYSYQMTRYNPDGTVDSSFAPPPLEGGHLMSSFALIELIPDGRFYLAITSRSHLGGSLNISRRFANGSADASYTPYSVTFGGSSFLSIGDLSLAIDGGLLATGGFSQAAVGFPPQQQMRKFLPDGSVAPGFAAPLVFSGNAVHQLPDGKILYSASGGNASRPLMRLEANGAVDSTYVLDPVVTAIKNSLRVDPMNRVVFLAQTANGPRLVRLLENGAIDPTFTVVFGMTSYVFRTAVQGDGKVIVSGPFASMNGTFRSGLARLNPDGTTDTTFNPGTGFSGGGGATHLVIQPDGKILAAGEFTAYNGTPGNIVRINPDGSRDDTFTVVTTPANMVGSVALQPDGKIVIGGSFNSVNGVTRSGVARLEANGAVDPTFETVVGSPSVSRILVEPSGKIMIGGTFTTVNGVSRSNLARLESNGALDETFTAPGVSFVEKIVRQPDGKYLIIEGTISELRRRNIDGSLDSGFEAPTRSNTGSSTILRDVLLQPDGTMLIAGRFDNVGGIPRFHVTRLKANGAHDPSFMPAGTNGSVMSLASYSSGKVLITGPFTSVSGVPRVGIARINVTPIRVTTPFDFDGDGRADISVFRSSTNRWYEALSSGPTIEETFGLSADILAPADFDGDGKTDEAIFRPNNGHWWYKSSIDGTQVLNPFGGPGDIPRPSDFDGDGKADLVLFRPSNNTWFRYSSLTNQEALPKVFGQAGDQPLVGDFDGDSRSDLTIFRPSSGDWWYAASSANGAFRTVHWGQNGDIPVPADYDGDGKTDYAVYRPSEGGWYVYNSSNLSFTTMAFGTSGDRPVAADYDGDGKADIAVFRPSTGIWYLLRSTSGFAGYQFGISTDTAIPGSMIP